MSQLEKGREGESVWLQPQIVARIAPALITLAFFLWVSGGRWLSKIPLGIPNLELPTALFLGGLLVSVFTGQAFWWLKTGSRRNLRFLKIFGIWTWIFICLVLAWALGTGSQLNFILRDIAPLLFIGCLWPLVGVFRGIETSALILVTRAAVIIHSAFFFFQRLVQVPENWQTFLAFGDATPFNFRSDFSGIVLGIGILAWGAWPNCKANRAMQGLIFLIACVNGSKAALVTIALCLVIEVLREREWFFRNGYRMVGLGLVVVTGLLFGPVLNALPTVPISTPSTAPSTAKGPASLVQLVGSVRARIITWEDVWDGLRENNNLILGAGVGSNALQDYCLIGTANRTKVDSDLIKDSFGVNGTYCGVDSGLGATKLRDPHNWVVHILLYLGFLGLLTFCVAIAFFMKASRNSKVHWLAFAWLVGTLAAGLFGVIVSTPFAMGPLVVAIAWSVASKQSTFTDATSKRRQF